MRSQHRRTRRAVFGHHVAPALPDRLTIGIGLLRYRLPDARIWRVLFAAQRPLKLCGVAFARCIRPAEKFGVVHAWVRLPAG